MQPVLNELHWVLLEYWSRFKVLVLFFKALNILGQNIIGDPSPNISSKEQNLLAVPGLKDI